MARILAALAAGLLFGLGLALGGMTDPAVVLGFLDIAGTWNPSLAFVMGAGVVITFFGYRLTIARGRPLLAPNFQLPTRKDIDPALVGGAAIFGVGWGLAGYCPGAAISSAVSGSLDVLALLAAMLAGMAIVRFARR